MGTANNIVASFFTIIVLVLIIKFGSNVNSILGVASTQTGNVINALQGNGQLVTNGGTSIG